MSVVASLINLNLEGKNVFAVNVPEWSTQHELIINSSSSWIKYPSPKGWDWIKFPINEKFKIIGLSTPNGFLNAGGVILNNGNEIYSTVIRSHIFTNAKKFNVEIKTTDVFLVLEMLLDS